MEDWKQRTRLLIGDDGIDQLGKSHVLVVGLGGVGAYAAEQLARFCRPFPVKINIIEYNETPDGKFHKSYPNHREAFIEYLNNCNMVVRVRASKGQDIAAACGQLVKKQGEHRE